MTKTRRRMFDGIPIVDAKTELRVFVSKADKTSAIRKDPAHCAFSNACRRLYGSHSVVFFRTLAYVELPDGKGGKRIERFMLRENTQRSIIAFDRRGKIDKDGYSLLPPSPGRTLDGLLNRDKVYRDSGMRRVAEERRKRCPVTIPKGPTDIRSGKGIVQFIRQEKHSIRKLFGAGA